MPRFFVHTQGFTRGEIDPSLYDRTDASELYKSGSKLVDNWFPDLTGSLTRRPALAPVYSGGSAVELPTPSTDNDIWLQSFTVGRTVYLVLLIGFPLKISVYRIAENGTVTLDVDQQAVTADESEKDGTLWQSVCSVQAGPSYFMTSHMFAPMRVIVNLTTGVATVQTITWYEEALGTVSVKNGDTEWEGQEDAVIDEQLQNGDVILFKGVSYTIDTTTPADPDDEPPTPPKFTTTTAYNGISVVDERISIRRSTQFSTIGNRPRLCAFHQGRLLLFSTKNRPVAMWASKSGDPFTILPGSIYDDAPIEVELFSQGVEAFLWVSVDSAVTLGGANAEYILNSDGSLLSPTNISFARASVTGGTSLPPVLTDASTIFVGRARANMHTITYDFSRDGFVGTDLSRLAPHLMEPRVRCVAFRPTTIRDPSPRIFTIMDDFSMRTCAYQEAENLIAWSRISMSQSYVPVGLATTSEQVYLVIKNLFSDSNRPTTFEDYRFVNETADVFDDYGSVANAVSDDDDLGVMTGALPAYFLARLNVDTTSEFLLDFEQQYTLTNGVAMLERPNQYSPLVVISTTRGFLGFYSSTSVIDIGDPTANDTIIVGSAFSSRLDMLPPAINDDGTGGRLNRLMRVARAVVSVRNTHQLSVNGEPLLGSTSVFVPSGLPPRTGSFTRYIMGWYESPELTLESSTIYPAQILSVSREVTF